MTDARPADGTVERHRMDFWGLVAIMPWLAPLLFVIDATVTTINLQPEVANLFVGVSQVTSYVIAFGVSATMIGASAMAGFALAAIRLSGRAAGLLFVVLFGLIMFKLTAGLDAIRMGSSSGVGTLTAATLAACFVAGLTGYAAAAFRDLKGQRELTLRLGSLLGDLLDRRDETRAAFQVADQRHKASIEAVDGLHGKIDGLKESAARSFSRALDRKAEGTAAQVDFAKIKALCATWVDQEIAAHDVWAVAAATMAWEKARAEKLPEGDDIRTPERETRERAAAPRGLSLLQKLAIGVLGVGALLGFLVGAMALAICAGLAAVLLVLGGLTHSEPVPVDPTCEKRPQIGSPASTSDKRWIFQPDHMTAGYSDGGAGSGTAQ